MKISIIVPAYNEAETLKRNIKIISNGISRILNNYEIIIAEDGSTDETTKIVMEIANENPKVIHLHSSQRLGKGLALKRAIKASEGEIITFMDADLATNLMNLIQLLKSIEGGYGITIGSRYVKGSYVERPLTRTIASRAYNLLVNLLFEDGIQDHQCGFKAFSRQALESIIDDVKSNGFFFDTELIVKARWKGFLITEIPVRWREMRKESTLRKIIMLAPLMTWELLMLKLSQFNRLRKVK